MFQFIFYYCAFFSHFSVGIMTWELFFLCSFVISLIGECSHCVAAKPIHSTPFLLSTDLLWAQHIHSIVHNLISDGFNSGVCASVFINLPAVVAVITLTMRAYVQWHLYLCSDVFRRKGCFSSHAPMLLKTHGSFKVKASHICIFFVKRCLYAVALNYSLNLMWQTDAELDWSKGISDRLMSTTAR